MLSTLQSGVDFLAGECILFPAVIGRFHKVSGPLVFLKGFFAKMPVMAAIDGGSTGTDLLKFRVLAKSIGKGMFVASAWTDYAKDFGNPVQIRAVACHNIDERKELIVVVDAADT
jgi:hypothetical protein